MEYKYTNGVFREFVSKLARVLTPCYGRVTELPGVFPMPAS